MRATGVLALLGGTLACLGMFIGLDAVAYDLEVFEDRSRLIEVGANAAGAIRASLVLNLLGNYLCLTPLVLLLFVWLRSSGDAAARLYTLGGVLYTALGAAGAWILAASWPGLIEQYAVAAPALQQALVAQFDGIAALAEQGFQGMSQNLAGAFWLLGMGNRLRAQRYGLGVLGMVVGSALLLNALGNLTGVAVLGLVGLLGNVLLGPLWAMLMGGSLLRTGLYPVQVADRSACGG